MRMFGLYGCCPEASHRKVYLARIPWDRHHYQQASRCSQADGDKPFLVRIGFVIRYEKSRKDRQKPELPRAQERRVRRSLIPPCLVRPTQTP
jgi:hypothetical protein